MSRWTAIGESRDGCHEIPAEIAARFVELGGQDIQVWDTDYIIDSDTQEAVDYVTEALSLSSVELKE